MVLNTFLYSHFSHIEHIKNYDWFWPQEHQTTCGAGTLGVPLGGTRRVGGLLGVAGRLSVLSEGGQPWDLFGSNDAKAETPVVWPPHAKS